MKDLNSTKQNKRWKNFKYQQTKLQMLAEVEKLKLKMLSMISKESDFQRNSVKIKIAVHFLSIFLHQKRNLKYFFFHNFPCIFLNILSLFQDYFLSIFLRVLFLFVLFRFQCVPSICSNILSLSRDYFVANDVNILLLFLVVRSCFKRLPFEFELQNGHFLWDLGRFG